MTREEKEAVAILQTMEYELSNQIGSKYCQKKYEAVKMSIKALEQKPILDNIRAEIIQLIQNGVLKIESGNEALFNIIDKYRGEVDCHSCKTEYDCYECKKYVESEDKDAT